MSNVDVRFYSNCLKRPVSFRMYLPYDERNDVPVEKNRHQLERTKTMFLLHGYTGDAFNWIPEQLCDQYNIAVVIPNGENSFWLDGLCTGHAYCSFLGEELLAFVRKTFHLAMNREETSICGFSMGGFGALHTALYYPEEFGKVIALSSAFIVHEVAAMKEGQGNSVANYEYYRECFGEPSKLLESDNNPETLVNKILAAGKQMPEIFMSCGTEDFLLERNREMHSFLEKAGVAHVYEEDSGNHNMEFWSKYVERFIPMLYE